MIGGGVCVQCENLILEEECTILSCPYHVICGMCVYDDWCPMCRPNITAMASITESAMCQSFIQIGPYIDSLCLFCGYFCTTYSKKGYRINVLFYEDGLLYFCDVCAEYYRLLTHDTKIEFMDGRIILEDRIVQQLND